jgi:hypothetical protein
MCSSPQATLKIFIRTVGGEAYITGAGVEKELKRCPSGHTPHVTKDPSSSKAAL